MKLCHLSTASALALVLALGLPSAGGAKDAPGQAAGAAGATEQRTDQAAPGATVTPPDEAVEVDTPAATAEDPITATEDPATAADEPAVTAQIGPDRLALDELEEKLGEIGVENREPFDGQVVVARTSEGDPFVMLIGPENFERGETIAFEAEDFDELRQQLSEAGFQHVRQEHAWPLVQGTLEDYHVLAGSGDPEWGPGADGPQVAMDFDRDRFEETLGDVGIEERTEFEGKLVRGSTEAGESITMLIGSEGFEGDEQIDLSESDLRNRFEDAGLRDVRMIDENIYMMRGSYEDKSVLAFGGPGFAEGPMATGTVAPAPQPETELDTPDEIEVEDDPEDID